MAHSNTAIAFNTITSPSPETNRAVSANAAKPFIPATMQAFVQDRYGECDTLQLRSIDVPRPAAGQVLIKVEAAGVDRGVWHLMTGQPWIIRIMGFGFSRPKQAIPGLDVSGRVVALGDAVSDFQVGDEVFGVGLGTYAEYALANAGKLALRPDGIDSEKAAGVPISGLTALQALRDIGQLRAGQRVLVIGASGGVGSYAVQIARHFEAEVTGVASTAKLDLVRSLGADRVIDYTSEDALDGSTQYDLIVDIGGRNPISKLRGSLLRNGTLVIVGGEGGDKLTGGIGRQLRAMLLSPFVAQRLTTFVSSERGADIEWLGRLLHTGDLKATVERTYRLSEAPAALNDLAAGRVRGKAVVQVVSSLPHTPNAPLHA
jgi:NADPH:quinone reductase-like Zn-dependent oxidoreductase